ncbi:MAG: hypothetical protein RL377_992 [Bacteroidota bacterium]
MQYLLRKQIVILIAMIGISTSAMSQIDEVYQPNHDELPYYLGMSIGASNSFLSFQRGVNFLTTPTDAANNIRPLETMYLNLGLTGTLRLSNHFALRTNPTLLISGNRSTMVYTTNSTDPAASLPTIYTIPSVIVDIPIGLKIQSDRYTAFKHPEMMRHYLITGVKFGFDLGSEKAATLSNGRPYANVFKGSDMAYELGLGLSFFLRYATISPEVKFSYGISDLRKISDSRFPLVSSVEKINSNFIYFTVHIEN